MVCEYDMTTADAVAAQQALAKPAAPAPAAKPRSTKFGKGLIGWVLFIGLAVILFVLLNNNPNHRAAMARRSEEMVPTDWPLFRAGFALTGLGVLMFLGMMGFGTYYRRSRRPMRDGHVAVQLDDGGVVMSTAYRRDALRWDAMLGSIETDWLFVLRTVGPHPVVLPKRAFAGAGEVDAVRALLAARIIPTAGRAPA